MDLEVKERAVSRVTPTCHPYAEQDGREGRGADGLSFGHVIVRPLGPQVWVWQELVWLSRAQ